MSNGYATNLRQREAQKRYLAVLLRDYCRWQFTAIFMAVIMCVVLVPVMFTVGAGKDYLLLGVLA